MNSDIYNTVSDDSFEASNPFRTTLKVAEPQVQAIKEQQDEEEEKLSNVDR